MFYISKGKLMIIFLKMAFLLYYICKIYIIVRKCLIKLSTFATAVILFYCTMSDCNQIKQILHIIFIVILLAWKQHFVYP